jgi:hypothetical protein
VASDDLRRLTERVTGRNLEDIDLAFAGLLAVDPERALEDYPGLTPEERSALISRDPAALQRSGMTEAGADAVTSGAHSQRCEEAVFRDGWFT